jgi:hypothetical protein
MQPDAGSQINVEYFFRLLYDCLLSTCRAGGGLSGALAFFAHLWVWITILGYLIAFAGLAIIVYCVMRLFALRHEEEEKLRHHPPRARDHPTNPRWAHIEQLMGATRPLLGARRSSRRTSCSPTCSRGRAITAKRSAIS